MKMENNVNRKMKNVIMCAYRGNGYVLDHNPLSIPMQCGWLREVTKQRFGGSRRIIYRAPCGRRMRNMDEVHRYLRVTGCQLSVDLFCFDASIHCFTEFEPDVVYSRINGTSTICAII